MAATAEQSGDRRSRRSRRLLKQGLLELLREKRFFQISVRDITERVDMNRGTFYLHYPDTAALMRSVVDDMAREAQNLIEAHMKETVESNSLRPVFEPLLDYIIERREECRLLFDNESGSGFLERLQKLVYQNGVDFIRALYAPPDENQLAYLLDFIAFGLVGLIKSWFSQGMILPKEDLIAAADRMVSGAAEKFLKAP